MKFKGPVFASYRERPSFNGDPSRIINRALPPGKTYIGTMTSKRAAMRNLRQLCRPILNSTHPDVIEMRVQLRELTAEEPEPEYGFLGLINAATDAAEGTGVTWAEAASYLITKFKERKTPGDEVTNA